jgi:hypothetical protein
MSDSELSRPLRVFLCHASVDKPAVRNLYRRLDAERVKPWLDEEDLIAGQEWEREIPKAVNNSDAVIVCLSCAALGKAGYIHKEIGFVLDAAEKRPEGTLFVMTARLDDCEVPERLKRWHYVDLFATRGYDRLMVALETRAKQVAELELYTPEFPPNTNPIASTPDSARTLSDRFAKVVISRSGDSLRDASRVGEVHHLLSSRPGPDRFCFLIKARAETLQLDFPHDTTTIDDLMITRLRNLPGVESVQVSMSL